VNQIPVFSRLALAAVCSLALLAIAQPAFAKKEKWSGFLGNEYSKLKEKKDALGVKRLVWVSPELVPGKYQKVLLEHIVFYPAPDATKEVSGEVLYQIRDYMYDQARKQFGEVIELTDKPGPGVLRLQIAITAASVEEGLKPWQYIPIALIVQGAEAAAHKRKHDVDLAVESKASDSVSGQLLGMSVRKSKGVDIKGKQKLTLDDCKPEINKWAEGARDFLAERLK
jgi:hypothetical protein